jgi:hypothetical protein
MTSIALSPQVAITTGDGAARAIAGAATAPSAASAQTAASAAGTPGTPGTPGTHVRAHHCLACVIAAGSSTAGRRVHIAV